MEHSFTDVGISSLEVGTELFKTLDITPYDLQSPTTLQKIREVASFLNEHEDPLFFIGSIRHNRNANMSNLDYLLSHAKLAKDRMLTQKKLAQLENELKYYAGN